MTRLALIHHDGSIGVLSEGATPEIAADEAAFANVNETDPEKMSRVARVEVKVIEVLTAPPGVPSCPGCGRPV